MDFPIVQWLRLHALTAKGVVNSWSSIPDRGTKIPQAAVHKKQNHNSRGKAREWDVHRQLWKALASSWDGDLDDDSACVGFTAQKRSDKTVSSATGWAWRSGQAWSEG